ncbi:MAG: helicase-related protein, partial [Alphaproteobacteria bacterium]
MAKKIEELASDILKNPLKIQTAKASSTVDKIDQKIITTSKNHKFSVLHYLLSNHKDGSVLVFCQTKHNANRISTRLAKCGFNNLVIHGNKSQSARDKAIKSFTNESVNIMVATDLASRGIDISKITLVINYDLPRDSENYVHRSGRTARAGRSGYAISICEPEEFRKIKLIENLINKEIPREDSSNLKGFKPIEISNNIVNKKPKTKDTKKFFGIGNKKNNNKSNQKKTRKFQKYENEFGAEKPFSFKKFGKKLF